MKKYILLTLLTCIFFIFSCEKTNEDVFKGAFAKGELAEVKITSIINIQATSAYVMCTLTNEGKGFITARGVCWDTITQPTLKNPHTAIKDTGNISMKMSNLKLGTTYYVRPYITNNAGTNFGNELNFTTKNIPTITTTSPTNITAVSATIGGNVTADGGDSVTVRGVCWSTDFQIPTNMLSTKTIDSLGLGKFTSHILGLEPGSICWVRAYATNSIGTSYGGLQIFSTSATYPIVTTNQVTNIYSTSAQFNGEITYNGGSLIIERGFCWSTISNPTIDLPTKIAYNNTSEIGIFSGASNNLQHATVYHVRAYATNSAGTAYGADVSFTTLPFLPTVSTNAITDITTSTATSGGNISSDGGDNVTARGVCWSTSPNPSTSNSKTTDGTGIGSFVSSITGLTPSTTYYLRSYATNSQGDSYGDVASFMTEDIPITFNSNLTYGTVSDIDGNIYKTIKIGTQTWMAENLKTTRYNDGTPIYLVTDNTTWTNLTTGAYCWYNNAISHKAVYGALYNWNAVNTGKLAPTGWHVPTTAELLTISGAKETGFNHWISPNTGGTNESGFTALPNGIRYVEGVFGGIGIFAFIWSSSAGMMAVYNDQSFISVGSGHKTGGFSVRCVKD